MNIGHLGCEQKIARSLTSGWRVAEARWLFHFRLTTVLNREMFDFPAVRVNTEDFYHLMVVVERLEYALDRLRLPVEVASLARLRDGVGCFIASTFQAHRYCAH